MCFIYRVRRTKRHKNWIQITCIGYLAERHKQKNAKFAIILRLHHYHCPCDRRRRRLFKFNWNHNKQIFTLLVASYSFSTKLRVTAINKHRKYKPLINKNRIKINLFLSLHSSQLTCCFYDNQMRAAALFYGPNS